MCSKSQEKKHPQSLGAFTASAACTELYATCDAMLVVGSRLRGNETLKYRLALPEPRYQRGRVEIALPSPWGILSWSPGETNPGDALRVEP